MDSSDASFVTIGQSVERLVRNMGGPPLSVLAGLEQNWPNVVGPALAGATRPIELVDQVLVIRCADGAWASQVQWMQNQIIENFTAVMGVDAKGRPLIKALTVRVGER